MDPVTLTEATVPEEINGLRVHVVVADCGELLVVRAGDAGSWDLESEKVFFCFELAEIRAQPRK